MKGSINLQQKVFSYLYQYGSTRESDLINYGTQKLGLSQAGIRKLIDEMLMRSILERIVHNELEPVAYYIKCGTLVPVKFELQAISESLSSDKIDQKKIKRAEQILSEAEAQALHAERRIRKKIVRG